MHPAYTYIPTQLFDIFLVKVWGTIRAGTAVEDDKSFEEAVLPTW
jgi:hypothetical protein